MIQIPAELFFIPKKVQPLVLLIPAGDLQGGGVGRALFLLEEESAVRRTHQAVCAGDHVKGVVGLLLPGVMHHHETDPIGVCKGLEPGNDLVVVGVAVIVPADLPDLLQRVYDDQRGVRVLSEKSGELFVQTAAKLFSRNGEEQVFVLCRSEHAVQALLQASIVIFQGKIEDCALPHGEAPERGSRADMVSDLCHKEALAQLRCPDEQIRSPAEQPVYDRRPALVHAVKELRHGYCFEIGRVR